MAVLDLVVREKGFKQALVVDGTYVKLLFNTKPDQQFLDNFKAKKLCHWPAIKNDIDTYIARVIAALIADGAGPNPKLRDLLETPEMDSWLQKAVFEDVNYGLAVIATSPNQCLVASAAPTRSELREQKFMQSLDRCYKDVLGRSNSKHSRAAHRMGMHWLDGCVFHIAKRAAAVARRVADDPK